MSQKIDIKKYKGRPPRAIMEEVKKQRALVKKKQDAIVVTQKLDLFLEEFLKNGGNATEAALKVFNCKSRGVATSVGSHYLKKAKQLGRVYLESKGYTYGRLLTIAAEKAETSKKPDWWDRVMKVAGYEDFTSSGKAGVAVNINQATSTKFSDFVTEVEIEEGEVVEDGEEN